MPTYDRDLVIEVCHDLINRAMRNEFDAIPDLAYSKIYRDQEAAIRSLLAAQEAATQEIERLRFYETTSAADAIRMLNEARAECERLRKLCGEACDWATPFDCRHDREPGGYSSELLPMFVRLGTQRRDERIAAIRHAAGLGDE